MIERHKHLDDLIRKGTPRSVAVCRLTLAAMILVALPICAWDLVARTVHGDWDKLTAPWRSAPPTHADSWGDLVQMAALPRYNRLFRQADWEKSITLDTRGFRERHDLARPIDYLLVGASFSAAGTTNEQTLSGQLEAIAGRPVRNMAWPGAGPVRSMQMLVEEGFEAQGPKPKVVVWAIVQRSLDAAGFRPLYARLDDLGHTRSPGLRDDLRVALRKTARWHRSKLQPFLNETSDLRRRAKSYAQYVPPAALDPGWTSPVKLAAYRGEPVVFLSEAVSSSFRSYRVRGGDTVVETLRRARAWLASQDIDLLVVLIPDKFEVLKIGLEPDLAPVDSVALETAVTSEFAGILSARGVKALDLYPNLVAAELRSREGAPTPFRLDDTHWSDQGILVAAQAIAKTLNRERAGQAPTN